MASKSAAKHPPRTRNALKSRPSTVRAPEPKPIAGTVREPDDVPELEPASVARSEGHRLLMGVTGSLQQIADAIGASKQAIAWWRTGARIPEERWRIKLQARYSIPPEAWDRVPGDAPAPVEWFPVTGREPSALEDCTRLLALLRSQLNRADLLGRERVQLGDAFARALAQKERLEKAREMLEARTVREHPEWRRLKRLIIDALLPHPAASKAVEEAILRVLGDEAAEIASDVG
jgi:transcriptional regulator with XRE-family HTH domain